MLWPSLEPVGARSRPAARLWVFRQAEFSQGVVHNTVENGTSERFRARPDQEGVTSYILKGGI